MDDAGRIPRVCIIHAGRDLVHGITAVDLPVGVILLYLVWLVRIIAVRIAAEPTSYVSWDVPIPN